MQIRTMRIFLSIWAVAWIFSCTKIDQHLVKISPELKQQLLAYLDSKGLPPDEYLLEKFKDHDIIFLGETHRLKQDPLFVQSLVPKLYQAGIRNLGTEFACVENQPLVDILVDNPEYHTELAVEIQRHIVGGTWPFQEYLDIFKEVWEFNHSLPKDAPKFRIVALTPYLNFEKRNFGTPQEVKAENMKLAGYDQTMAEGILKQIVARGEKGLIYCGIHHAFTRYYQPIVENGKFVRFNKQRAGNIVYEAIGDRAITLCLHHPWPDFTQKETFFYLPFWGFLDQVYHDYGRPVGLDLVNTPFSKLTDFKAYYSYGYADFKASDIYDGYLMLDELKNYQGVTLIKNWVDSDQRLESLKRSLPNQEWGRTLQSKEEFQHGIESDTKFQERNRKLIAQLEKLLQG